LYNRSLSAEQIKVLAQKRSDLLVSQELSDGDTWQGSVVPNDGTQDGTIVYSNELNITESLPVAYFTANITSGTAPLSVTFTDTSTGTPTSWNWNFGDGGTSTEKNPTHIYNVNGTYPVFLNATNAVGSNTFTQSNYIIVGSGKGDNTIIGFRWNTSDSSPRLYQIDSTGAIIANKTATFWDNWNVTGNIKTVVVNATNSTVVLYGTNNRGDGLDLSGASGDVMVEIPRFYTCSTYANGNFSYYISPLPVTGFTVAPLFNQRGIGTAAGTPALYYYVGRYDANLSGTKLISATGKAPAVYMTIGQARTYAENKGAGWGITSIWTLSGLRQLFYTEMLTLDSQTAWAKSRGIVAGSIAKNSGADSIDTQISANNATGSGTSANGYTPVSYRGIENLWGNVNQFQDGFNAIQGTTNVINATGLGVTGQKTTFKDVLDANDVQSIGALVLSEGYQKNLLNTDVARPLFLPSEVGGSETTYLSDYYYPPQSTNPSTPNILFSGGASHNQGSAGVGRLWPPNLASYSNSDIGARVEFRRSTAPGASFTSTNISVATNSTSRGWEGVTPFTMVFNDTSTNAPASWKWGRNNLTVTAWEQIGTTNNITQTFIAGNWSVNVTAINSGGSAISTQVTWVNVSAASGSFAPVANFTATPTSGTAPLVVQFTDTSTNLPTNWNWSFGDGTFSTAQNTSHTFTPGIFSISLNATNTQGSNISTMTAYIHSNFASPVMFRNTENRTGVYSDGGTRPGNSLKWNFTAGGDVHSSPVISGGVLYVGSSDGRLYALNASTGLEQWRYSFGAEVFSSPAVANGVVFVGTNDNNLYALNATTGAKIWNFTTGNHIIGSPALADGTVYIGSADNTLYALNPTTGEKLWDTAPGLYLDSSPAVSNGSVFIGSWDYRVYAFNATTGSGLWDYTTGNAIESSPAVENHTVFIGSDDHNLYALNAMTGAKIWNFTTGGYIYSSPAVSGGVVYVGSDDKNVYALDAVTGAKLWNFSALNAIRSSPAIANGVLYVGSHDGRLYALNATTGEKLWDYLTEEWTWVESSPAVSGGVVYFGGDTDKVYALHQIQPMANFTANVTSGTVQLSVRFTDTSTGSPSAWYWSFGDLVLDNISTLQHPVHTYGTTGNFTVSLNVTSSAGSNVTIKTGYITVSSPRTTGPVHNLNSGMNYTGIQLAVENATAFDTILVDSGQYPETVNITRPLMLRGNETGTGPPVIDPGTPGVNTAITLSADNITLDGFVARNARAGVHITGSNATLRNITATQNDVGISLDSSRRNRITRAEVYNNTNDGITLVGSSDTTIDRSWVHANSGTGITWVKSANITFTDNVIDFNRAYGLYLKNSEGNTVSGNNLSTNDYGIALEHVKTSTFSHNFAGNNSGKGIYLDDTTGCVFTQNDAPQNGDVGINLFNTSRFNAFTENRAMHNVNKGFYLDASYNNTFTRDNASFNSYGFSLYTSNNNTFSGINSTYQQSGMSLANSSGNIVTGGNILWNTLGGIGMEYAEENRFCGITLAGNN
ncbi:MAG: PQQ-binding-like beta-propeller repeat protein, partial [Methanoregula sp.]